MVVVVIEVAKTNDVKRFCANSSELKLRLKKNIKCNKSLIDFKDSLKQIYKV
mgnify:CR=1 FL=1